MRLYLDTEFSEDGKTIDLISIAVVAENGREFYRQSAQANLKAVNPWVKDNVLPKLWACPKGITGPRHMYGPCGDNNCVWRGRRGIARELFEFVGLLSKPDGFTWVKPEFWGYYADYDWVVLCQLYGAMVDLPPGWPMYCRDLKQVADDFFPGVKLDEEVPQVAEHNSLGDARWNRAIHEWMISQEEVLQILDARERDEREVSTRQVDQEPGHVRSTEAEGNVEVSGGGDLERDTQQNRQTGQASPEEVARSIVGKVVIGEEGVTLV